MKLQDKDISDLIDLLAQGYIRKADHPDLPLSIYNYTQKTQFEGHWTPVTRQARGLILDDEYDIIVKPPEKFFNYDDPLAENVERNHARYSAKLDGYMIIVKKDSEWGLIVASRGSFTTQYAEAAKNFITKEVIEKMVPDWSYFCELCQNFPGDEAIILTQHPVPKLVCWAIRDKDFNEVIPDDTCPFPIAKELSLFEADQYLTEKVEGVVAQDLTTFERVKIKTPWFLEHHRLLSDCTKKRAWEILSNYQKIDDLDIPDEFMAQMKQYEKEIGQEFDAVWKEVQNAKFATANLTDKELGLLDKYQELKPLIFLLRKNRTFECFEKIWQKIKPRNVV